MPAPPSVAFEGLEAPEGPVVVELAPAEAAAAVEAPPDEDAAGARAWWRVVAAAGELAGGVA